MLHNVYTMLIKIQTKSMGWLGRADDFCHKDFFSLDLKVNLLFVTLYHDEHCRFYIQYRISAVDDYGKVKINYSSIFLWNMLIFCLILKINWEKKSAAEVNHHIKTTHCTMFWVICKLHGRKLTSRHRTALFLSKIWCLGMTMNWENLSTHNSWYFFFFHHAWYPFVCNQ